MPDSAPSPLIGYDTSELRLLMQELGQPSYRGNQIAKWLYQHQARSFDGMTNLPNTLRQQLSGQSECPDRQCPYGPFIVGRSEVAFQSDSRDGTTKLLLSLLDGQTVETVRLPYEGRVSCCISTQVGCPVRCAFCATGHGGYARNLTTGEIVDQVLTVNELRPESRVSHVVFMGMGEPLLNYNATLKAVRLLNREVGIGMRHLTVSTVGYVPGIRRLAEELLQLSLAVSLHAPTDALRRQLIPTMSRWSISDIIAACRYYFAQTGRRITFEYCLLAGVNDGTAEARELARILRGLNCHVNLIPFNPVADLGFDTTSPERARAFLEVLEAAGIPVTHREQRGADIDAACGQLRRRTVQGEARLSLA